MKLNKSFLAICFSLLTIVPLWADEIEVTAQKMIDWEEGIVTLDITAASEEAWTALSSRYNMDKLISKRAPVLTAETISDIPVSSLDTIGSALRKNTSLYGDLLNLPDQVGKTFSTAAEDRKSLTVRYDFPIYPHIASLFIDRMSADPVRVDLRYEPTARFTGIIIYAAQPLPLRGTNKEVLINPSVFPRLFDENLNVILDMSKVDPLYLEQWGTAGYSHDENREYYGDRVGAFPLRTVARGLFGANGTDLILSESTVRKILSNEHNRNLINQGRVMIICQKPQ